MYCKALFEKKHRRLRIKSAYLQNWQFWLFQFFLENIPEGAAWKNIVFHGNVAKCLWTFSINAYLQLLNRHKFKNAYAQDLKNQKFESVIYEKSKLRMSISACYVDIGSEVWIMKSAYDV